MKKSTLLALFVLVSMTSCMTHEYSFNTNPDVGSLSSHPLSGKKIYFDFSQVPAVYDQKANGHEFHITDIRESANQLSRKFFKNDKVVDNSAAADVVLALNLDIQLKAAFMGTSCTSNATWRISSSNGKELAVGKATATSDIPTMSVGGNNCEITFLTAMPEALDNAMNKLR